METIIIQTESKTTSKLLLELAKQLGQKAGVLSNDIVEDLSLGNMMQEQKTGKMVSRETIMAELLK